MAKGNKITAIAADLTRLVGRAYGDRGLLGAAVHPEFGTGVGKDWIYVGYVWEGTKEVVERYFGGVKETWGGDAFVANGGRRVMGENCGDDANHSFADGSASLTSLDARDSGCSLNLGLDLNR